MSSLDTLFAREFSETMRIRATRSALNLFKLPVPPLECPVNAKKIYIRGIKENYYSQLNKTSAILWTKPKLIKRKCGSDGSFLLDRNGEVQTINVTLPNDCVALVSPIKIGVPTRFNSAEKFMYVDYVRNKSGVIMYVYIVPRKYCHTINETALILCSKSMRSYYNGMSMYLQNGHKIYIYVVPFKVTSVPRSYRVLCTKMSLNYSSELNSIINYWLRSGICFAKNLTQLSEPVRDMTNVAYKSLGSTLEEYVPYSESSLADVQVDINSIV